MESENSWLYNFNYNNVKYTVIKFNLYFMVHSNVWNFEKIWLSGILIIIRKPKVWWTEGRTDERIWGSLYTPNSRRAGGIIIDHSFIRICV
jgi:hypothetical protein